MSINKSARPGLFLVIEGTDGSGKGTQFKLLKERLENNGYAVAAFDFPQYDLGSSFFVKEYLNGNYGTAEEVGPYTGSLFYALDRYQASNQIRQALEDGKIVIANRYTGSNMAHQGTKFATPEERKGYFIWLENLEFQMLRIPRPSASIILRVPAEIAQTLVDLKEPRAYTVKKRDIHEADLSHLERSVQVYDDMCELFPRDFVRLDAVQNGKLQPIEVIHEQIWESIQQLLPAPTGKPGSIAMQTVNSHNPFVKKDEKGHWVISSAGQDFLAESVTNTEGDVYGFKDKLGPMTIAAAMARLSRRGDDMRVTILDEFAETAGKDAKLLQRVITAYGDDSVQQLIGQYIVVENASNLLTKKLEWGRLAAYLEQSTRYIYFDQKDSQGNYRYYVPEHFKSDVKKEYRRVMNSIFDLYSEMVHQLTKYLQKNSITPVNERDGAWKGAIRAQACDAVRPVLPVATKSTVGIYASGQALESLIIHLLGDELPEANIAGRNILTEARKTIPTFLERADKPDRGGATMAYRANTYKAVQDLAKAYLPNAHADESEAVQLNSVWPRNEMDLLPDMLYEHSTLPLGSIRKEVETWDYERKNEVFTAYIGERLNRRHRPGRALEIAHYSWDLVCDYGIFRDLQRHRMVDDLEWQFLTPRYGYEMSHLIEDADLTESFEKCFDLSLGLYSYLQQAELVLEAQYATLLGHKMRWKVTYNGREAFHLHELRTSPQGHPSYRKLVQEMHEKLSQVHPILGEAMIFVNKGEDKELTRLAAERYTQFKLTHLG
ncbi:MAG: FAD-dependent thymidylate synthase [Candidatus Saccharibacteria bacterium]